MLTHSDSLHYFSFLFTCMFACWSLWIHVMCVKKKNRGLILRALQAREGYLMVSSFLTFVLGIEPAQMISLCDLQQLYPPRCWDAPLLTKHLSNLVVSKPLYIISLPFLQFHFHSYNLTSILTILLSFLQFNFHSCNFTSILTISRSFL